MLLARRGAGTKILKTMHILLGTFSLVDVSYNSSDFQLSEQWDFSRNKNSSTPDDVSTARKAKKVETIYFHVRV